MGCKCNEVGVGLRSSSLLYYGFCVREVGGVFNTWDTRTKAFHRYS